MTVPTWLEALHGPVHLVAVVRRPEAVARSLARRDGMPEATALALWERYQRHLLDALTSRAAFAVSYEALVAEPDATVDAMVTWLATVELDPSNRVSARSRLRVPVEPASIEPPTASGLAALHDAVADHHGRVRPPGAAVSPPEPAEVGRLLREQPGPPRWDLLRTRLHVERSTR